MGWVIVGIFVGVQIVVLLLSAFLDKDVQQKVDEKQHQAEVERETEGRRQAYRERRSRLFKRYGEPDNIIILGAYDLSKDIFVFGKTGRIWLLGRDLPMTDILGCSVVDEQAIEVDDAAKITSGCNVIVNIDSLSVPAVSIHLDGDRETANEIVGLMNAITSGNKS